MKFFITLCLIVSLATIALTGSASWGRYKVGDQLLYSENVVRRPQSGNNWNVVVYYPKHGRGGNISLINVIDRFANNSGALANLWAGGPGNRYAKIGLNGQRGKGINSSVEIYGNY